MGKTRHQSALDSHYDKEAETYDLFNEKNSTAINRYLEKIFTECRVKTILDLTCGTGSQVFWLHKSGFAVVGYDISGKMLEIAKRKAAKENLDVKFFKGDLRTTQVGEFDAVITIFNAIGHLTKKDFTKALQNVRANLKPRGIYVFDIFNFNYLIDDNNITRLTIDRMKKSGDTTVREIQYSTISPDGILTSYDIYHERKGSGEPKISSACQTLQVYSKSQLREILEKNGFKVISQGGIDSRGFHETNTERILTVAEKK